MNAHRFAKRISIAAVLTAAASPAAADAIDGDWCSPTDAKHFRIDGPNITTPAGTRTTGDYSRHAFFYVVPEGDPGAGQAILMLLLNEEEVQLAVDGGEPKIWRRCDLTS